METDSNKEKVQQVFERESETVVRSSQRYVRFTTDSKPPEVLKEEINNSKPTDRLKQGINGRKSSAEISIMYLYLTGSHPNLLAASCIFHIIMYMYCVLS
jgi:hypothetical protein